MEIAGLLTALGLTAAVMAIVWCMDLWETRGRPRSNSEAAERHVDTSTSACLGDVSRDRDDMPLSASAAVDLET